jgi:DnaJ domain
LIYLLAAAFLVFVLWGAGDRHLRRFRTWRVGSGLAAIGVLALAGFLVVRGLLIAAVVLGVVSLGLALSARWPRSLPLRPPNGEAMSLDEARAILGVGPTATADEIRAAYTRLMRRAHPDQGGTTGLAAQVNAARDRLSRP